MRRSIGCLLAVALVLSLAACQKGSATPEGTREGVAGAKSARVAAARRAAGPILEGVANRLPKNSPVVVVIDVKSAISSVKALAGRFLTMVDMPALDADLSRVFERFLGFDPMKIDYVVGFMDPKAQMGGVFVAGPFEGAKLPGGKTKTVAGLEALMLDDKVVLAPVEGGLFLGTEGALVGFVAKDNKLAGTDLLKGHLAAFDRVGAGVYVVSAHLAPYVAMLPSPFKGAKVSFVSLAGGGGDGRFAASMAGDKAARDMVKGSINMGLGAARAFVSELAAKIDSEKPEEALGAVFAKHLGPVVLDLLHVKDDGEALTVSVRIPGMESYVTMSAGAGVLAAVAIPAFIKYKERAREVRGGARCEQAYDHIMELAKKENLPEAAIKEMASGEGRRKGIESCQKEDPAQVECALRAESFEDLSNCSPK